jgi:hypothetical protein
VRATNGALLTTTSAGHRAETIWLITEPDATDQPPKASDYILPAVDAAVHGGRWVVSLDDRLRRGLASGNGEALNVWSGATAGLRFLEQKREWIDAPPAGPLMVLSGFDPDDGFLAYEVMNLLPRRRLPYRPVDHDHALAAPMHGIEAVFCADSRPPEPALRKRLLQFANSGGKLFTRTAWTDPPTEPMEAAPHLVFDLFPLGKGTLAVAKEDEPDPWEVACDVQAVMGRDKDALRLFNGTSVNCVYKASPDDAEAAVHLVNYSRRNGLPFALYLRRRFESAKLYTPESGDGIPLKAEPQMDGGIELLLPPIEVYGLVVLKA